jgi:transcriptional regulator with PAS, ATPase and Fis domain
LNNSVLILNLVYSQGINSNYQSLGSKSNYIFKNITDNINPLQLINDTEPSIIIVISDDTNIYKAVGISQLSPVDNILVVASDDFDISHYEKFYENFNNILINPSPEDLFLECTNQIVGNINDDEIESASKNLLKKISLSGIIGRDPNFLEAISKIPLIAEHDIDILLLGETGVGKEVCARAIHYLSNRAEQPFIPVNCGTIPDALFENEMFGHHKGAFTDARQKTSGLLNEADSGTIFLDEIDSLSFHAQSKLLRVIQEKSYRPLGTSKDEKVDVRIIAATNSDISEKINNKSFRSDLYYRFGTSISIPPLRERKIDIPLLARHFLEKYTLSENKIVKKLSPAASRKLLYYNWPGNVRELENIIRQSIILSLGKEIKPQNLDIPVSDKMIEEKDYTFNRAKKTAIEDFEKQFVTQMMAAADGNISKAAQLAKKDRADFSRLVKKYSINSNNMNEPLNSYH